jgi:hypothetical protein
VAVQVHVQSVLGSVFSGLPITVQVTVPVERFVGAGG